MPPAAPSIIFFDAAGTLIHLPRGVGFHYGNVARRHGFEVTDSALDSAFREAWKGAPAKPPTRLPRPDDEKEWWRDLVHDVLDRCGAPGHLGRDPFFEELYLEFARPGVWALYPEVVEVLEALRPRHRLGIISNFDGRLRPILEEWKLLRFFEVFVISSEVGSEKPDSWIFERAAELAGVRPSEALHVGDDPHCDWSGATAAGMAAFQLDRPRNSLREVLQFIP